MNLEQMDATSDDDHVDIIDGIVDLGIGQDNQRNNIRMKNQTQPTENPNNLYRHQQQPKTTISPEMKKSMNPKSISKLIDRDEDTASELRDITTTFLLRLLTNEIARDGGACLVTTLKDYIIDGSGHREPLKVQSLTSSRSIFGNKSKKGRNQQLNSLLIHSNVGKPKLLAFLESHPNVFCVDRSVIPHWVQLVKPMTVSIEGQPATSNSDVMKQQIATNSSVNGFERTETAGKNNNDPITDSYPLRENLRTKLFHKALYVLRKRQARIDRRTEKKSSNTALVVPAADTNTATGINEMSDSGVFNHWLLRQCSWELHFLLRHCGFYQDPTLCGYETPSDVKHVGSKGWEDVTLPIFERLLRTGKDTTSCNDNGGQLLVVSWIHIIAGKAILRQSCSDEEYQRQSDIDGNHDETKIDSIVRSFFAADEGERGKGCEEQELQETPKNRDDNDGDGATFSLSLVRRIDQTLTEIVCQKDGGHQVSLQLILHRYPHFKELLGGRDLWKLYCDFSDCENNDADGIENENENIEKNADSSAISAIDSRRVFFFQSISMFYSGANLIIKSKRSKTNECDVIGNDDCINKHSGKEKRMKVDEEGLYSVTNNKWGKAMSNLVIQASRQTNLFGGEQVSVGRVVNDEEQEGQGDGEVESSHSSTVSRMVIDLTASVGGMTLALAKSNFFDRVVALEIDEGRADLCRENLSRHGFHDLSSSTASGRSIVEIRHQDSVEQIPFLPRRACFVIDPPWGGYDYKEQLRRQQEKGGQLLKLGDTPLEDVLAMMSHQNSPCVVGLRLPTNFSVHNFLNALRTKEEGIEFECMTIRKVSVQIFVVLYFPPSS
jgi:hypothetical protein